jgi:cytochrome P450
MMLPFSPRLLAACKRRYGSTFTVRAMGVDTLVYVTDPVDVKAVFAGDPAVYRAGEANALLTGLMGDSSVLLIDGDTHRDRRRLMMAPFRRDAVNRQAAAIADIAAADVDTWPVGTEFAVGPKMAALTLDVILQTVVGTTDPARLAGLRAVMPRLLQVGFFGMAAIGNPQLLDRRPWHAMRTRIQEADRLLYAEIADRRIDPALAERTDQLSMLVRAADEDGRSMTDVELRDQLMTLLFAGHDTTAISLTWTMERLVRHPAVLKRAVEAADASAAGDSAGDDYLDAVIKEALRVRPVVSRVGRVLAEPVELGGYHLPAGTIVVIAIGLVQSDPQNYSQPDQFDPDRMLESTPSPTIWLPFGGGNRRCLGATFANVEMRLVLREVLRRVDLETTTAPSERQKVRHVILEPHRGGRIRVRARLRSDEDSESSS